MTVQILRARDRLETPWKNGGGVTREIAVFPPGAGLDTFDWRVSMATVTAGGPFSLFPGVDRILSVLEGELHLCLDNEVKLDLSPGSPPAAFSGDAAVRAEPPASPVTDLNVMTRRGRVRARVDHLTLDGARAGTATETTLILTLSSGVRVGHECGVWDLGRFDAALVQYASGESIELSSVGSGAVIKIDFDASDRRNRMA